MDVFIYKHMDVLPDIQTHGLTLIVTLFSTAISGYLFGYRIFGINNQSDIRYPTKKVSSATLIYTCLCIRGLEMPLYLPMDMNMRCKMDTEHPRTSQV